MLDWMIELGACSSERHGGIAGSGASQPHSLRVSGSIMSLLYVCGVACSPSVHVGFLWLLRFPQISQKHANGLASKV